MASLGSLSFLLETSIGSGCTILKRGKTQLKRNQIVASYGRNRLGPSAAFKMGVGYEFGGEEGKKGKKGILATRKSGGIEGEEDGSENEDIAEKVLQKTIKQIKKIAERKKLVSSIKSSAVSTELDRASSDESDNSFSKLDTNSNSGKLESKYSSGTDGFSDLTDIISVNPPASDSTEFFYKDEEFDNILPPERSIAAALGLSGGEASLLVAAQSEIVSPSLSRLSEPYVVKKVNFDNLIKFDVEGASAEHDATPLECASAELDATPEKGSDSSPLAGENVMNVILVASECAPWSKSGGLGDVAGALPKALARRGHRVMVVTPRYGNYSEAKYLGVHKRYKVHGQDMEVSYYHAHIDGVDFVFMDGPDFRHRQNDMYGGKRVDILKRMILLCKAAVEVPWHVPCGGTCYGDGNLVFIANDWHTALIPVYLKAYYRDNGLMTYTRCVVVIHNISFQGRGPVDDFRYLDLPDHYLDLFKHDDPVGGEHMNIFLAGLKSADRFITVSHGYAWELKTVEGGWGLHAIINHNHWKFQGIVNGIDANEWNPSCDVHLKSDGYTNYSLETLQTGKAQCKAALQRELGLPIRDDIPLIGFIGRLDYQKGVDIIAEAMPWIAGHDLQLVMLGTGRVDLEDMLRSFEDQHPNKVRGRVCFSVELAHRITAGADCILMPSRFEPCGLNQLYAMMYGTIPVVHAVGGLRDTVQQFDPLSQTGLGWTFGKAEANGLIDALAKCFRTYWHDKSGWEGLQRRGMMQDLSWDNAATQYEKVLVAAKYHW